MRVTREFGGYNPRRYGRPWIAIVTDWPIGKPPTLAFGGNVGPHMTEIEAEPGMIVRWGQRDNRRGNHESRWGIIQRNGSIVETHIEDCREHWIAGCPVPPRLEDEVKNALDQREGK